MNNTNVTIPPSYYEYKDNGEKKIFTYKFIKFSSLKPCPQSVIDIINQNTQQVLIDYKMDPKKLSDKVFLFIIDLFPVYKFDDIGSWKQFGIICWLLGYPCEYWDYFFKKSITKYNYHNNLKHYINVHIL